MAYKPVTRAFGDMRGFEPIIAKTVNNSIRNAHIPVSSDAGEISIGVYRKDKDYFVAELDLPLSPGQFDGFCGKIPSIINKDFYNKPELNIRRAIPFGSGEITYTVVIKPDLYGKSVQIGMLLPEAFTDPSQVVNGYHYYAASGEEKDSMYEMAMAILNDSVRNLHIFRRVERYHDKCVTKVCFEPRKDVSYKEMTRIIREMLRDENGESLASLSCKESDYEPAFIYNTEITSERVSGTFFGRIHRSDIVFKFNKLIEATGTEIPDDAEVSMEERYTTRFRRKASVFFRTLGNTICTPYDYAIGRYIKRARERERLRIQTENSRFEYWLRNKVRVPTNERGYDQSCFLIVNPACETNVREGKSPGEPGDKLELVGASESPEAK